MTDAGYSVCAECGMGCNAGEYHPYAACLMFKHCRNSETVRANLKAVRQQGRVEAFKEASRKLDNLRDRCLTSNETDLHDFERWLAQAAQDEKGVGAQMGERFKYHELFKKWQAWRDPDELVAEYEKYEAAQTQLTQLQALVRALPVVNGEIRSIGQNVVNGEHNYLSRLDSCLEAGAYTALLQYRATLDATTPAPRQRQVHSCEIPGCVSCANPEEGGDGE